MRENDLYLMPNGLKRSLVFESWNIQEQYYLRADGTVDRRGASGRDHGSNRARPGAAEMNEHLGTSTASRNLWANATNAMAAAARWYAPTITHWTSRCCATARAASSPLITLHERCRPQAPYISGGVLPCLASEDLTIANRRLQLHHCCATNGRCSLRVVRRHGLANRPYCGHISPLLRVIYKLLICGRNSPPIPDRTRRTSA